MYYKEFNKFKAFCSCLSIKMDILYNCGITFFVSLSIPLLLYPNIIFFFLRKRTKYEAVCVNKGKRPFFRQMEMNPLYASKFLPVIDSMKFINS